MFYFCLPLRSGKCFLYALIQFPISLYRRLIELTRRYLLEAGADPNITDAEGKTALSLIRHYGDQEPPAALVEMKRLLLAHGTDPTIPDAEGNIYSCLTDACWAVQGAVVEYVVGE